MTFLVDLSWQHCRFHWTNASGRRALFAVYNNETGLWSCWISGSGMVRHDFIACSQSGAISQALCIAARWSPGWKLQNVRKTLYRLWDGIPDIPRVIPRQGFQLDLFTMGAEVQKSLSNTGLLSQFETERDATTTPPAFEINHLTPRQGGVAFVSRGMPAVSP